MCAILCADACTQESAKDPVAFVQGLLSLRDKYDAIVNDAFRGEKRSQKRLKEVSQQGSLLCLSVCLFVCVSLACVCSPFVAVAVLLLLSVQAVNFACM